MAFVEGYTPSEEPSKEAFGETAKRVAMHMLEKLEPKMLRAKGLSVFKAMLWEDSDPEKYLRAVIYTQEGNLSMATDYISKAASRQVKAMRPRRLSADIDAAQRDDALQLVEASWVLQRYRTDSLLANGGISPEKYATSFIAIDQQRYLRELQIIDEPTPFREYDVYQSCDRILATAA